MRLITRRNLDNQEMAALEAYLGGALQQVAPRSEYVAGLKQRLVNDSLPREVKRSQQMRRYMPLIIAGVLGGIVLLVTGVRAIVTLLSSMGVANSKPERA
jgi:hypothetical protein